MFGNPAHSSLANGLLDLNRKRAYINSDGRSMYLHANGAAMELHGNAVAVLRYDEWKDIDREVLQVMTDRLVGIADLIAKGLTHNLGSIGHTISQWQRQSNITPANINMSGITRGEKDRPVFDTKFIPVPIVHKDFSFNIRHLEASRTFGAAIDTSTSQMAARVVAEGSEDLLFSGSTISVDGGTIYGYLTHPDRNTVSIGSAWTSLTGPQILANVQAALVKLRLAKFFGPYTVYIPAAYEGRMDDDFNPGTSDTRTIRQRIMALAGVTEITVADRLPADNVVVVQLSKDVVDLAIAQDVTTVQWQNMGGMEEEFKVMAVWAPRVKSTYDGQSGLCHIS